MKGSPEPGARDEAGTVSQEDKREDCDGRASYLAASGQSHRVQVGRERERERK